MISSRVVNASPLIFLNRANLLDVLREPATQIFVPEAVLEELRERDVGDSAAETVLRTSWLSVVATPPTPTVLEPWKIHAGELADLALAIMTPGSQVILDDLAARRCARALNLPLPGTLGLVLAAKRKE